MGLLSWYGCHMSPLDIILCLAILAYAAYEIYIGYRLYNLSGYPFYLTANLLVAGAFILAVIILVFFTGRPLHGWEASVLVLWLIGNIYRGWEKKRASERDPLRWRRWEEAQKRRQ